jgi:hypothetical protein
MTNQNSVNLGQIIPRRDISKFNTSGVYFLYDASAVIYAGQAIDLVARIKSHSSLGKIPFDSFSWIQAPLDELNDLEAYYIFTLDPIYNNTIPTNSRFLQEKQCLKKLKKEFSVVLTADELSSLPITIRRFPNSHWGELRFYDIEQVLVCVSK